MYDACVNIFIYIYLHTHIHTHVIKKFRISVYRISIFICWSTSAQPTWHSSEMGKLERLHSHTSCSQAHLTLPPSHLHIGNLYTAHCAKCHRNHLKAAKESQTPFVESSEMKEQTLENSKGPKLEPCPRPLCVVGLMKTAFCFCHLTQHCMCSSCSPRKNTGS